MVNLLFALYAIQHIAKSRLCSRNIWVQEQWPLDLCPGSGVASICVLVSHCPSVMSQLRFRLLPHSVIYLDKRVKGHVQGSKYGTWANIWVPVRLLTVLSNLFCAHLKYAKIVVGLKIRASFLFPFVLKLNSEY